MTRAVLATLAVAALGLVPAGAQENGRSMADVRLMTLDPGHFHAALVQKEMYPGVAPRVDVYAPLGPDLVDLVPRFVPDEAMRSKLLVENPSRLYWN